MQYLVGTDEAGYGPNLGPLVISATLWQVPQGTDGEDLYDRLAEVIVPTREQAARNTAARVAMADSKVLYRPGKGLRHLERGLWAALALLDRRPETWSQVWHALAPEAAGDLRAIPWYAEYDSPVPLQLDPDELKPLRPALHRGLAAAGVRLLELRSRAVFPRQFNELVERHGSKGTALSHLTFELISQVMEPLDEGSISIICDKHGGRNRYAGQLQAAWCADWIDVVRETRAESSYRLRDDGVEHDVHFRSGGEAFLPTALASMTSKYLRELAMRAFNAFWCERVADLRPTAGYPQDARRFKSAIAAAQAELDIPDVLLWRSR